MSKQRATVVLLLAVVVVVAAWYALRERRIDTLFGGRANAAIIKRVDRVEVYRVGPLADLADWRNVPYSAYPVTDDPVVLPADLAAEVASALISPRAERSYLWDAAKACIPTYGVGLSFIRGAERVDVLLCFECNTLLVGRGGRNLGVEDFDPARAVLLRAAQHAFPDDPAIQALQ